MPHEIPPRSGTAFLLGKGHTLTVTDVLGEQVADLLAFNQHDIGEVISSGRTLDYASKIYLSTGDLLYSNRSQVMLEIIAAHIRLALQSDTSSLHNGMYHENVFMCC